MIALIDAAGAQEQLEFREGMTVAEAFAEVKWAPDRLDIVLMNQEVVPPPFGTEVPEGGVIRVLRIVSGG